jgi:hypothetical protein
MLGIGKCTRRTDVLPLRAALVLVPGIRVLLPRCCGPSIAGDADRRRPGAVRCHVTQ